MTDFNVAKLDPSSYFTRPADVLKDKSLTREQKIDILKRWAYDQREIAVAEEENMLDSNEQHPEILDEILQSLLSIKVEGDQDSPPPTKQG